MLRKAFGWFVVLMGVFVLGQQLPGELRSNSLLRIGVAVVAAVAVAVVVLRGRRKPEPQCEPIGSVPVGSASGR